MPFLFQFVLPSDNRLHRCHRFRTPHSLPANLKTTNHYPARRDHGHDLYRQISFRRPRQTPLLPKYKNALMTRLKKSTGKCLPIRPIPKSANSTSWRTVNQAMPISQDFAYVTGEALRLNKLTHGALDVTVGPLVNLWDSARKKKSHTNQPHKKSNMLQKWSVRTNSNFPKTESSLHLPKPIPKSI